MLRTLSCRACCSDIYGLVCLCVRVCGRRIPEHRVWTYLIQIAEGLQYIHSRRILHRDLKVALALQSVVDLADPAAAIVVRSLVPLLQGFAHRSCCPCLW